MIPLLWAIALNGNTTHLLERLSAIGFTAEGWLTRKQRSPLNPVLGWARLLQNGNLDAIRQREALATIERNAKLQTQLIEDLLHISRIVILACLRSTYAALANSLAILGAWSKHSRDRADCLCRRNRSAASHAGWLSEAHHKTCGA